MMGWNGRHDARGVELSISVYSTLARISVNLVLGKARKSVVIEYLMSLGRICSPAMFPPPTLKRLLFPAVQYPIRLC